MRQSLGGLSGADFLVARDLNDTNKFAFGAGFEVALGFFIIGLPCLTFYLGFFQSRMQTRISLKSIVDIIERFTEAQRQAVVDIGFGGLLGIRCTRLNHQLCTWLVENFDPNAVSLTVHGHQLRLTSKDVYV